MNTIKRWILCGLTLVCGMNSGWLVFERRAQSQDAAGVAAAAAAKSKADKEASKKLVEAQKAAQARIRAAEQIIKKDGPLDAASKLTLEQHLKNLMAALKRNVDPDNAGVCRTKIMGFMALNPKMKQELRKVCADVIFNEAMIAVRDPKLSTASKINAMWLVADLDLGQPSAVDPPIPYGPATQALMQIVTSEREPIYLRCIAIVGLEKHVRILYSKWPDNTKKFVDTACMKIVKGQPANNLDAVGYTWLMRRAIGVVGAMKSRSAVDFAVAQLVDAKALPSMRLESAYYLAKFDLSLEKPEVKAQIFLGGSQLLYQECASWLEAQQDVSRLRGMGGGMDSMMGGGMPGMDGGMSGGMPGMDSGMGMAGMGGGMPGMDGGGMGMPGMEGGMTGDGGMGGTGVAKLVDRQNWETRIGRKKLNTFTQVIHVLFDGLPYKDFKKPATAPKGGSIFGSAFDRAMPEMQVPSMKVLDALDAFQTAVNRKSLSDAQGTVGMSASVLQTALPIPSNDLKIEIEKIPGFEKYLPPKKPRIEFAAKKKSNPDDGKKAAAAAGAVNNPGALAPAQQPAVAPGQPPAAPGIVPGTAPAKAGASAPNAAAPGAPNKPAGTTAPMVPAGGSAPVPKAP